jgi:hypothetical protein
MAVFVLQKSSGELQLKWSVPGRPAPTASSPTGHLRQPEVSGAVIAESEKKQTARSMAWSQDDRMIATGSEDQIAR